MHRNLPDSTKLCCPTETAARSTRHEPLSPTPPPSATDSPHSTSPNCCPRPPAQCDIPSSVPHSYNMPVTGLPSGSAHCTTSPRHTTSCFAPDDSPPSPIPHCQNCNRGSSPSYRPAATAPASHHTCPCKTPKHKPCAKVVHCLVPNS